MKKLWQMLRNEWKPLKKQEKKETPKQKIKAWVLSSDDYNTISGLVHNALFCGLHIERLALTKEGYTIIVYTTADTHHHMTRYVAKHNLIPLKALQ